MGFLESMSRPERVGVLGEWSGGVSVPDVVSQSFMYGRLQRLLPRFSPSDSYAARAKISSWCQWLPACPKPWYLDRRSWVAGLLHVLPRGPHHRFRLACTDNVALGLGVRVTRAVCLMVVVGVRTKLRGDKQPPLFSGGMPCSGSGSRWPSPSMGTPESVDEPTVRGQFSFSLRSI